MCDNGFIRKEKKRKDKKEEANYFLYSKSDCFSLSGTPKWMYDKQQKINNTKKLNFLYILLRLRLIFLFYFFLSNFILFYSAILFFFFFFFFISFFIIDYSTTERRKRKETYVA